MDLHNSLSHKENINWVDTPLAGGLMATVS